MRQYLYRTLGIVFILLLVVSIWNIVYSISMPSSASLSHWDRLLVSPVAAQTNQTPLPSTVPITSTRSCSDTLDIMLVLDGSGSISSRDFQRIRDFASQIVNDLNVGTTTTHIGIVQFASTAQLEHSLSDDPTQVLSAIQNLQQLGTGTQIGAGITVAQSEIEGGGRADAIPLIILLTDGISSDDPVPLAKAAQGAGIRIIAIGVGGYDINQLQAIASEPKDQAVFELTSFDTLANLNEPIATVACNASVLLSAIPAIPLWIWLCLPLLLLPIPAIILLRAATLRSLRNAPMPPVFTIPETYTGQPAAVPLSSDPFPFTSPLTLEYQPALLIGLGKAGRWTLTHVKSSLQETNNSSPVGLLAFDFAPAPQTEDLPIAVQTATTEGIVAIQLREEVPNELHLLSNTALPASQFIQQVQAEPSTCPILVQWLQSASITEQHTMLRIQFLVQLSDVTVQIRQAVAQLQERGGRDIFLIASLEEEIGVATVLDCTQLVQLVATHLNLPVAIHLWIYTPTRQLHYSTASPAAWSVMRTIERLQTCFANQPPTPPLFDWHLTGLYPSPNSIWSEKLATSCTLINSDRDTNPLHTVAPQDGLYLMVADTIGGLLEMPASGVIQEHRANVNTRSAQYQQELDIALYSSWGAFTYLIRPAALMVDGATQMILDLHHALLSDPAQSLADDLREFNSFVTQAIHYKLFDALITQDLSGYHSSLAISEWLEPPDTRGSLMQVTPQILPNSVRRSVVTAHAQDIEHAYMNYVQTYVSQPDGLWYQYLATHTNNIQLQFHHKLIEYLLLMLNSQVSGRLLQALRLLNALEKQIHLLQQHVEQISQSEHPYTFPSDQTFVTELNQYPPSLWRTITGNVTSVQQDTLLNERHLALDHRMGIMIAERIHTLCHNLNAIITQTTHALTVQQAHIQNEYESAQVTLQVARQRRLGQIERGAVEHEWGMPHTDVRPLRKFLDPDVPLPNDSQLRRHAQRLRDYVAGQYIQELWNLSARTTLPQQNLSWMWDEASVPSFALVYTPDGQVSTPYSYRIPSETLLRHVANETYAWVWSLNLPELLVSEQDDSRQFATQLSNERAAPSVIYRATTRDRHELHTFLIATPTPSGKAASWLRDVVANQQMRGLQRASHRWITGGNPYRLGYLPSYEIIGALAQGALPDHDWLRESYQSSSNPVALPLARQEQLAAIYEQWDKRRTAPLHRHLVDVLFDQERLQLFAKALLVNAFRATSNRQIIIPTLPHTVFTSWLDALRWWMYAATTQHIEDLSEQVQLQFEAVSVDTYETWLQNGIPTILQQSEQGAERDLARLLQYILDPLFYSTDAQ